jgi:DNA processing protein
MSENQLLFQLALTQLSSVGNNIAKNLVAYLGSAEAIFKASQKQLISIPNIGEKRAKAIIDNKNFALDFAKSEIKFIEKNKIQPLFFTDKKYPKRLLNCADSPILLYFKGDADLNSKKIISIVGTRRITDYGKKQTERIVEALAIHQPLIVSGLAYGVDIHAHKSAIKNNLATVAVVASGMNKIYPNEHIKYVKQMCENGGVITEYCSNTEPEKPHFPERNRIVAGMCDALIVVETSEKGGAMITANLANDYNRDVFALPGKVDDEFSKGCNALIKNNKAILFENAEDIAKSMLWDVFNQNKKNAKQKKIFLDFTADEQKIFSIIQNSSPIHLDEIQIQSAFSASQLSNIILQLELKSAIKMLPGKYFEA